MKKIILLTCVLLTSMATTARVDGDSVKTKERGKIVVCKSKQENSKKGEIDLQFRMNLGMNTMTGAPNDYSFKIWPSWDFGMAVTADWYPFGARNSWSLGLGVNWRKYRSGSDSFWVKGGNGEMALLPYTSLINDINAPNNCKTTLHVFSLQVPVLYTHYFDNEQDWYVTLGAIVNFNTGAHTAQYYEVGNQDYEINTNKIGQRPVTIDLMLQLGIPSFPDLYVKYSPTTFFKDGRGPKMHQMSFGFYF